MRGWKSASDHVPVVAEVDVQLNASFAASPPLEDDRADSRQCEALPDGQHQVHLSE
jgi:hypothetical protein